ncbi:hypothetical protein [Salinivibrio costicola]|nr:hypothetical protein [Salinivibrio costicola]
MDVMNKDYVIEIKKMNKWYGEFHALKDINLKVIERQLRWPV